MSESNGANVGRVEQVTGVVVDAVFPDKLPEIYSAVKIEMNGGDGYARYGAVRVTHVGKDYLILDWAFQTDPGNPELVRAR